MFSAASSQFVRAGTYFITVRLQDPQSDLLVANIDLLRQSIRVCRQQMPFELGSAVILPNRMHMIWTLPPGDGDYGKRLRMIKSTFARHIPSRRYRSRAAIEAKGKGIWQRRYWEVPINTADDLALYERLIRDAPVDEGLVKRPKDWRYSSYSRRAVDGFLYGT